MALNENLQNVVNDLKTAKESIAANLSTGNLGIASSDGLETIASQLAGKKVNDTSGVTATASDILSGKKIIGTDGTTITGNIPSKSSSDMSTSLSDSVLSITSPAGYYPSGITAMLDRVHPGTPLLYYNSTNNTIAAQSFGPDSAGYIAAHELGTSVSSKTPASLEPNGNLIASNIKSGVNIFGITGTASCVLGQGFLSVTDPTNQYLHITLPVSFTNIYYVIMHAFNSTDNDDLEPYSGNIYKILYRPYRYYQSQWAYNCEGQTDDWINDWDNWVDLNIYPQYSMLQFAKTDNAQSVGWIWDPTGYQYLIIGE